MTTSNQLLLERGKVLIEEANAVMERAREVMSRPVSSKTLIREAEFAMTAVDRVLAAAARNGVEFNYRHDEELGVLLKLAGQFHNQPIDLRELVNSGLGDWIGDWLTHWRSKDSGGDWDEFLDSIVKFPMVKDRSHALSLLSFGKKKFRNPENRQNNISTVAGYLVKLHCAACAVQPCDVRTTECDFRMMERIHICHQKKRSDGGKNLDPNKAMYKGWSTFKGEVNKGKCIMACYLHHDDIRKQE